MAQATLLPLIDLPDIDDDGLLRYRGAWVALSPKEEVVLRQLLAGGQRVVSRQRLLAAGWPGSGATTALDKVMGRLRRRLAPLGLTIHTVRARGFLFGTLTTPEAAVAVDVAHDLTKGLSWLIS
ncbi:MAG: helix-turn-helix domain-containing protein [Acidimicrobiales bacterium]